MIKRIESSFALLAVSAAIGCGVILLAGCAMAEKGGSESPSHRPNAKSTAKESMPGVPPPSLYKRLGGEEAITEVVDELLKRVTEDPRIKQRFEGANTARLGHMLIEQLIAASGGPKTYTGGDMKTVHRGMEITGAEFDALVGDLADALKACKVPESEQKELLGLLAPMRGDIVDPLSPLDKRMGRIEKSLGDIQGRLGEIQGDVKTIKSSPATKPAEAPKTPIQPDESFHPPKWLPSELAVAKNVIARYAKEPLKTEGENRRDLLDHPLQQTRFLNQAGELIDLNTVKGKKIVLVVMRGFSGVFCLHCSSQLVALSENLERFKQRGIELFVVYPGEAKTVPAFVKATGKLQPGFAPPFPLLLDVDLSAVRTFMIEGNLAKPTTMILDESGIVRWAYVGKQPADRPSVEAILAAADRLKK